MTHSAAIAGSYLERGRGLSDCSAREAMYSRIAASTNWLIDGGISLCSRSFSSASSVSPLNVRLIGRLRESTLRGIAPQLTRVCSIVHHFITTIVDNGIVSYIMPRVNGQPSVSRRVAGRMAF
jgi:hypothetical protein